MHSTAQLVTLTLLFVKNGKQQTNLHGIFTVDNPDVVAG